MKSMKMRKLLKLFEKEISELKKKIADNNIFNVYYHADLDGLTSAFLIYRNYPSKSINFKACTLNLENYIEDNNYFSIFVDLASSYFINLDIDAFIIDHHDVEVNKCKFPIINPKLRGIKKNYTASKIIFDILDKKGDFEKLAALLGIYGDFCMEDWKDFEKDVLKSLNMSKEEFLYIYDHLNAPLILQGRKLCDDVLNLLISSKDVKELVSKLDVFNKYYKILKDEVRKLEDEFNRKADIIGKLCFFNLRSKYAQMLSYFSSYILEKNKDLIIFVYKETKNRIIVSCRSKKYNILKLLEEIKKKVPFEYGGHKNACGIRFSKKKDFNEFRRILFEKFL